MVWRVALMAPLPSNTAAMIGDDVWTRVEAGAEIASEFATVREERLRLEPDRGRPDQTNATGVQQRKILNESVAADQILPPVPMTSGGMFAGLTCPTVAITGRDTTGVAACNQVRSFATKARVRAGRARYVEALEAATIDEIISRVPSIIDPGWTARLTSVDSPAALRPGSIIYAILHLSARPI